MKRFTALLLTTLLDVAAGLCALALFGLGVWALINAGVDVGLAVFATAAAVLAGVWMLAGPLALGRRWRDGVFGLFGFGPAPSRPPDPGPGGLIDAKNRVFGHTVAVTAASTLILAVPAAILIAPRIGASLLEAAEFVLLIEIAIGAPTVVGIAARAHVRSRDEFIGPDRGEDGRSGPAGTPAP